MRFYPLLLLGLLALVLTACAGQSSSVKLASAETLPSFLDGAPAEVRDSYRFAVANGHELSKYPCYCGCGNIGHTSNLDCYVRPSNGEGVLRFDRHGAGCGVCVAITQDVMQQLKEGKSSREIRAYIDATYSRYGPPTNTPLVE